MTWLTLTLLVVVVLAVSAFLGAIVEKDKQPLKCIDTLRDKVKTTEERLTRLGEPLSEDLISDLLRRSGHDPAMVDGCVCFKEEGEQYYFTRKDGSAFFLVLELGLRWEDWEEDLLRYAALQATYDVMLVKVRIEETEDRTRIVFHTPCLDANIASFERNLPKYIDIIKAGCSQVLRLYDGMQKERKGEEAVREMISVFPRTGSVTS